MSEPALRLVPNEDGELVHDACSECARLRGVIFNQEQDMRRLEKDLRAEREKLEVALADKDAKLQRDKFYPIALELIEEWKRECGHPKSKTDDPKRVRLALSVVKRYKDERDKLSLVIQHGKHLAYIDPDTGFKYDEFGRLFGSSDEIEKRATQFYLWKKRQA